VIDFIGLAAVLRSRARRPSDRCINGLGDLPPAFAHSYPQTAWIAGFDFKIMGLDLILQATPSYRRYLAKA
jgi:hypothetical protein